MEQTKNIPTALLHSIEEEIMSVSLHKIVDAYFLIRDKENALQHMIDHQEKGTLELSLSAFDSRFKFLDLVWMKMKFLLQ
jgi:hypothetical protein